MKKLSVRLIRLYQRIPFSSHYNCRFYPTCSNYAIEALEEYGFFKGWFLAIKRILRCNPFGGCGYDPLVKRCNKDI